MKKALIIGGIVLAGIVGGGMGLVNVLEGRTEQLVRDVLAQAPASAEGVRYSLWKNQLDVTGVQFELDLISQKMKGRVESIAVSGFDPECLNPEAEGWPRVAETLEMRGLTWETVIGKPKSAARVVLTSSMQEARMEDWHQNLGRLIAQEWESEAFWTEAYRYKLAMASSKNYTVTINMEGVPQPFTEHIAMFGLLGPVNGDSASKDDNLGGRTLSFFANDTTFELPDMDTTLTLQRTEMRDVVMPAPAYMVAILDLNNKMLENPEDTQIAMQVLEQMGKAYEKQSPCRTILLQGMEIKNKKLGVPSIRWQELEQTLEIGTPVRFGLRLSGLNVELTKEQLAQLAPLDAFLPQAASEGVSTDVAFMLALNPESVGVSRLDWSTSALGLADAKGSVDFELAVSSLKDFILPSVSMEKAFKFKEATLDYTDKGLIAAGAAAYGQAAGISAEAAQQILLAQAPALAQFGQQGVVLADAIKVMVENPGTMTASLTLAKAALFEHALLMLLLEPQSVTLKVKAEPGKPFADWLPASLK